MDFRQTARSRLLRVAQNARARGNTTRRLEHQARRADVADVCKMNLAFSA